MIYTLRILCLLIYLQILVSSIIAFSESSGGKTRKYFDVSDMYQIMNKVAHSIQLLIQSRCIFLVDFKLGFDLTQGGIGAPSLRIRDFKGILSRSYAR